MDDEAIGFEDWERVLRTDVPPQLQRAYPEAIANAYSWLTAAEGRHRV